jgi:asparagine N-glycosylation enzyme membrane subunit Stt3
MYQLAKEQQVSYDKGFFDYFNSNKINPLYSKEGFNVTKILKQEDGAIVPNIGIEIVTQKAVTQRLKSA